MTKNTNPACRFCGATLRHTFIDLGMSPPCESYLAVEQLNQMEPFYPLHVRTCSKCFLVQLEEYISAEEIFTKYAYFSSYSTSWVEHARQYVEMITDRLQLSAESLVVELASNDGYLLQHFLPRGIPVLGIEPARNVAAAAVAKNIPRSSHDGSLPSPFRPAHARLCLQQTQRGTRRADVPVHSRRGH